jgi:ATP synthase protein I
MDPNPKLPDNEIVQETLNEEQLKEQNKAKERQFIVRSLSMVSQLGFTMAVCVCIGVFAGRYLDRLLGTAPWLLVVGSLIGSVAAFKSLWDLAKNWDDKK